MKSDIKIEYFKKLSEYKTYKIFSLISILNYKVKVFYNVCIFFSVLKAALLDDNYLKI